MRVWTEYVQPPLRRLGIYQRLKASPLYDLYWRAADRRIIDDRDSEVRFYCKLLQGMPKGGLIYDIGANLGYKTDIFLRLGAQVLAVDPDPVSQEILKQKFLRYRFRKKPVIIVGKAVSDRNSVQTMWIDRPGSALNTLSSKWARALRSDALRFGQRVTFEESRTVETTTMKDLVAGFGKPFFVKIDVEGHEPQVLQSMTEPVPYLSFEVNLPEFKEEGLACISMLRNLADDAEFNYAARLTDGLQMPGWLPGSEFVDAFCEVREKSIEVLCRTSSAGPTPSA